MQPDYRLECAVVETRGDRLWSPRYADGYADQADPVAESLSVFIQANDLPNRWQSASAAGQTRFAILELGFGSGLNFLVTLAAWRQFLATDRGALRFLSFVSTEGHPLSTAAAQRALSAPHVRGLPFRSRLLANWPPPLKSSFRLLVDASTELVVFQDEIVPALDAIEPQGLRQFDAIYLDGFAPARNPAMWRHGVLSRVANLARDGATFSTYSAAGEVRRTLVSLSASVRKTQGFGVKKHRLSGEFRESKLPRRKIHALPVATKRDGNIIVIGAGLAGSATAFCLARRGLPVEVVCGEPHPPSIPSANAHAVYFPAVTADFNPRSRFLWQAVLELQQFLAVHPQIAHRRCGALFVANSPKLIDRYQAYADSYADILELEFVDRAATAARAGMALDAPALWLADAGIVDAGALCRTWLGHHGIKVHPAATVQQLQRGANDWQVITDQRVLHADTVVLACGSASPLFERWLPFPLDRAAGRLTRVRGNSELSRLKTVVCADAYITPALGNSGEHAIGATWSLGNVTVEAASADAENIVGLKRALGTTTSDCRVTGGMTGVRLLSPDRLPLLGEIDDGLFVNLAHGSRGVTTSWLSGDIVAAMINAETLPITNRVARAALATRHVRR